MKTCASLRSPVSATRAKACQPGADVAKMQPAVRIDSLDLPVFPAAALQLLIQVGNPDAGLKEVATTVSQDPAMCAAIMQLANSAYYARAGAEIKTIDRAVMALGAQVVRTLAISIGVMHSMSLSPTPHFSPTGFWRDSVLRGCLARQLAAEVAPGLAEEAYISGLLQDLGIAVLALNERKQPALHGFGIMLEQSDGCPLSLYQMERQAGLLDHVGVIGYLVERWNFPKSLAFPLSNHHRRPSGPSAKGELNILWAIAYFVGAVPFRIVAKDDGCDLRDFVLNHLGVSAETLVGVLDRATLEFESTRDTFARVIPPNATVAPSMRQAQAYLAA